MARAKGVNQSQAIRDHLAANPKASAKEVVEALSKNGMTVKEGLVYAVKGAMSEKKKRKARVVRAAKAAHSDDTAGSKADALTMIRAVKSLAEKAGGYQKLMQLVEALAE